MLAPYRGEEGVRNIILYVLFFLGETVLGMFKLTTGNK